MLYIPIVILVLIIMILTYWVVHLQKSFTDAIALCEKWEGYHEQVTEDLSATRIGMDEMQEAYEMDLMTMREKNDKQFNIIMERNQEIDELKAHLDKHDRECLPNNFDSSWRPHVSTDETVDPPLYIV